MTTLTHDEASAMQQRWREVFAQGVHRAHGVWIYRGYDWHAFSYALTPCVHGAGALEAYREAIAKVPVRTTFIVLDASGDEEGWIDAAPREYGGRDVSVTPANFSWTMCFTHEQDAGIGPFFARAAERGRR